MVSYTYSDVHSALQLTTTGVRAITAVQTENLMDWAINLLNIYGNCGISNMSGTGGSKTVTLTSAQAGAVFMITRALYYSGFLDQLISTSAGVGVTPVSILENPTFERLLRSAAAMLAPHSILRT